MSTEWGDLERRLRELGSDLGDAPLPGPHSARQRARQRTRRQVAGATLGAVAAAAVGAVVLGGLGPLSLSQPDPADTPTSTPTPSPTGGVVEPGNELALTIEDLEASSGADEPVGWRSTDGPPGEPFLCAPEPGGADRVIEQWFQPSDEAYLHQIIEISTAEAARARFDSVAEDLPACVEERDAENPDDNQLSSVWTVDGIGDGAWLAEYFVPPRGPNGELMVVQVSVVLAGDTVTIITQGGPGMHGIEAGPLPYEIAMAAADRLCSWAGRDCTGDPTPGRVNPPVRTDVEPGWLNIDDIVTAMPFFGTISEVGDIFEGDAYGHVCMEPANPVAAGAAGVTSRQYTDPLDEALEIQFSEFIAQFDSDQAARAHYEDMLGAMEACGANQLGGVNATDFEGLAWRAADEFVAFHLVAVISGSNVAVVVVGEPSSAQDALPSDQTVGLIDRVGVRLAELD